VLNVLYEDNHLIAVEKMPGDLSQADKTGIAPLSDKVKDYVKQKYNKPGEVFIGTIHRLDRPVGGVILYARTSKALERMNKAFKEKQTDKRYWALVEGKPKVAADRIVMSLRKNAKQNKSYPVAEGSKDAKVSILNYKTIAEGDRYTLLEITLETGRHHQIRCQLSAIGHPIKGDVKYGAKRPEPEGYIFLHSISLAFEHPVKKEPIKIECYPTQPKLWASFSPKK
jgi:23S rRNA pseudouridine1911/1915/1917 synthase